MWWMPGLFAMVFALIVTMLMLASCLATQRNDWRGRLFVKVFAVMLGVEIIGTIGAVVFIVMAETGRI